MLLFLKDHLPNLELNVALPRSATDSVHGKWFLELKEICTLMKLFTGHYKSN